MSEPKKAARRRDVMEINSDYRTHAHDGSPDADIRCFRCGRPVRAPRYAIWVDSEGLMRQVGDIKGADRYRIGSECTKAVPDGFLHGM
jgi:hypothetical protein